MWTGRPAEQEAARAAGLDAGDARLGTDLESREAELEEVAHALLLTESDEFNALAGYELRQDLGAGRVFRLAPSPGSLDLEPDYAEGGVLFDRELTYAELSTRLAGGARLQVLDWREAAADGRPNALPLFAFGGDGTLRVLSADGGTEEVAARRALCLVPGGGASGSRDSIGRPSAGGARGGDRPSGPLAR